MKIDENPFERWNLEPDSDLKTLTRVMRNLIRELDGEKRQQLQEQWRELTTDPVARARWIALTPPSVSQCRDPWRAAEEFLEEAPCPELPPLEPRLDDALVLPLMTDETLIAAPPFLPSLLSATPPAQKSRSRGSVEEDDR